MYTGIHECIHEFMNVILQNCRYTNHRSQATYDDTRDLRYAYIFPITRQVTKAVVIDVPVVARLSESRIPFQGTLDGA